MVEPRRSTLLSGTTSAERTDEDLGDNGADLARGGGNAVGSRSVACREALAWNDESRRVRSEIEEEFGKDIASEQTACADCVVSETYYAEEDGEDDKATKLDWLAAESVNSSHGHPVAGDGAGTDKDDVANTDVEESLINILSLAITNSLQNRGVVQTDAVEGNIEEEPRASGAE